MCSNFNTPSHARVVGSKCLIQQTNILAVDVRNVGHQWYLPAEKHSKHLSSIISVTWYKYSSDSEQGYSTKYPDDLLLMCSYINCHQETLTLKTAIINSDLLNWRFLREKTVIKDSSNLLRIWSDLLIWCRSLAVRKWGQGWKRWVLASHWPDLCLYAQVAAPCELENFPPNVDECRLLHLRQPS